MPLVRVGELQRFAIQPRIRHRFMDAHRATEAVKRDIDPDFERENKYPTPLDLHQDRFGFGFIPGRHFQIINDHLIALMRREIRSLLITAPPQHGKSDFISVTFPAWYLGKNPTHHAIGTSYSSDHAQSFGGLARDAVRDHGDGLGVRLDPSRRGRGWWGIAEGGRLASMGLDAGITGKAAHVLICDDPNRNPQQAHSPSHRKRLLANWLQGCETRLQPDGLRIVVATRWADDDLLGYLLREQASSWTHLHLEAICTDSEFDEKQLRFSPNLKPRSKGEALWPEHYTEEVLAERRRLVGEYVWNTMYQGRPMKRPPETNGLIAYESCRAAETTVVPVTKTLPVEASCDVARKPTGDRVVWAIGRNDELHIGSTVDEIIWKKGQSIDQTINDSIALIVKHKIRVFRVDDTGIGGGVTDGLMARKFDRQEPPPPELRDCEIIGINWASSAFRPEMHINIKTEMWMNVADKLREGKLKLPHKIYQSDNGKMLVEQNDVVVDDLTAPRLLTSSNGRNQLESKERMATRGIGSTDFADAIAMLVYPYDWFSGVQVWS